LVKARVVSSTDPWHLASSHVVTRTDTELPDTTIPELAIVAGGRELAACLVEVLEALEMMVEVAVAVVELAGTATAA
jgi:hypothetical protein